MRSMKLALLAASALTVSRPRVFDSVKIKTSYANEADIPEGFASLYTETDGAWSLTGVEGIKTVKDVSAVSEALRKERNDSKVLREKLRGIFGEQYDLDEVGERFGKLEELQALVDGGDFKDPKKIDALVAAKVKGIVAPLERERDTLKAQVGTLSSENEGFKTANKTRTIHDAIREAAAKGKLLPEAMDDALMLGERQLELNDEGHVVTKDVAASGPGLTPGDWLTDLQTRRPHWWGESSGGGAGGGAGAKGGGPNPWSHDGWNLTQQGQVLKANPTRAAALAAAVGVKVTGGVRPVKK